MPSARQHDSINVASYAALLIGYSVAHAQGVVPPAPPATLIAFTVGFVAGTYLLSPDLDLHGSRPKKRWGALRILWRPYATLMPHRGLSHGYILGPLTRIAYLTLILSPLLLIPQVLTLASTHAHLIAPTILPAALGYYAATWLHLIADRAPLRW